MRALITRWPSTLGFVIALVVLAFVIVDNRNINQELSSQQITTRETQYEGCLRTNERTDDTNSKFANIYQIFQTAAEGNPKLKIQLQDKEDEFAQLTKTPCEKAYPPLPGAPPRKK